MYILSFGTVLRWRMVACREKDLAHLSIEESRSFWPSHLFFICKVLSIEVLWLSRASCMPRQSFVFSVRGHVIFFFLAGSRRPLFRRSRAAPITLFLFFLLLVSHANNSNDYNEIWLEKGGLENNFFLTKTLSNECVFSTLNYLYLVI